MEQLERKNEYSGYLTMIDNFPLGAYKDVKAFIGENALDILYAFEEGYDNGIIKTNKLFDTWFLNNLPEVEDTMREDYLIDSLADGEI